MRLLRRGLQARHVDNIINPHTKALKFLDIIGHGVTIGRPCERIKKQ